MPESFKSGGACRWFAGVVVVGVALGLSGGALAGPEAAAGRIVADTGIDKGVCVVLGCGDGSLAAAVAGRGDFLIQALDPAPERVAAARENITAKGLYGQRLSVQVSPLGTLPYPDNFVNLVVVADAEAGGLSAAEIRRVLRPGGAAWAADAALKEQFAADAALKVRQAGDALVAQKQRPAGMDDWGQLRHAADNNPVSADRFAGPPFRSQWFAEPVNKFDNHYFGRAVSASGRTFYYGLLKGRQLLYAYDAHNGYRLWRREVPVRGSKHPTYSLAAVEEVLYNIGPARGCEVIDAQTGKVRAVYQAPDSPAEAAWDYLAYSDGLLLGAARGVFALDPATGKAVWKGVGGSPLCVGEGKVFLQLPDRAVSAVDVKTGKEVWKNADAALTKVASGGAEAVCHAGVLVVAWGRGATAGLSAKDGRVLWTLDHGIGKRGGAAGLILGEGLYGAWNYRVTEMIAGFDPATGRLREKLLVRNGRCLRNTGVGDWFVSAGGVYLANVKTRQNYFYGVSRSCCQIGTIFASGLAYTFPNDCVCGYTVRGVLGIAPAGEWRPGGPGDPMEQRLEKGPAFGQVAAAADGESWPTFRKDIRNSAATAAAVGMPLETLWTAKVLGVPTGAAIAGGSAVVGTSAHKVYCLDAATGAERWTHTAGGAVPVTPTIHEGTVLVADEGGSVSCLSLADGRLVWRFRAAPERRMVSYYGRLASTWLITTGVLVDGGVAYVCAGRCAYDGIYAYALDAKTGKVLWENRTLGDFGEKVIKYLYKPGEPKSFEEVGYTETSLASHAGLCPEGAMVATKEHVIIPCGSGPPAWLSRKDGKLFQASGGGGRGGRRLVVFGGRLLRGLDPNEDPETPYQWGRGGFYSVGTASPREGRRGAPDFKLSLSGQPLKTVRESTAHAYDHHTFAFSGPVVAVGEDDLYGAIWRPGLSQLTGCSVAPGEAPTDLAVKVRWVVEAPMKARSALVAGGTFFCAGEKYPAQPPAEGPAAEGPAAGEPAAAKPPAGGSPAAKPAAAKPASEKAAETPVLPTTNAGLLLAVDAAAGKKLAEIDLPARPVEDGMSAARLGSPKSAPGRLIVALVDGTVLCLGGR